MQTNSTKQRQSKKKQSDYSEWGLPERSRKDKKKDYSKDRERKRAS